MHPATRVAALKLIRHDTLLVKEVDSPVAFKLYITDPLTTAQMGMLATASPFSPLIITIQTERWNDAMQALDASINTIESRPRPAPSKHRIVLRWGLTKRKRGYLSHD
jgi:hypothetical protein